MTLEPYDPSKRSPARRNSASAAARTARSKQFRAVATDVPKNKSFDRGTKVRFTDGNIVEPPIGAVIAISGEHAHSYGAAAGRRYDYAAIRASNGRWYTTGSTCPPFGYRWLDFLDFLIRLENAEGERLR